MPQKEPGAWRLPVRRCVVLGGALGLGAGVWSSLFSDDPRGFAGALAYYGPLGVAAALMTWISCYRYAFGSVWGWRVTCSAFGACFLLIAVANTLGCLWGACGDV